MILLPIRLIRSAGKISIAAWVATLATLSAGASTVAKVRHHAPHASVAVRPPTVTLNATLDCVCLLSIRRTRLCGN
jgi:hypothetical protein